MSVHAVSHAALGNVPTAVTDNAFILGTYYAGPVIAGAGLFRSRRWAGPLLSATMIAGFVYGATFHFLVAGPDNVGSLPAGAWAAVFTGTAAILGMLEAAAAFAGVQLSLKRTHDAAGPIL